MHDETHEHEQVNPETAADIAAGTTPEGEESLPLEDEVAELRAVLAQRDEELAQARNAYLRAHADFDNFRKRLRAERDQEFERGTDKALSDLLPILDDFERALAAVTEQSTVESLQQGVELIYRQVLSLLERYGIRPMEALGQPFDPMLHDAVTMLTTTEAPEHSILAEVQKGYLKHENVFRHAKVVVAAEPQ